MVAQRIRVSFFDPDATDSDTGDDDNTHLRRRKAGTKSEVIISVPTCTNNISPTQASAIIRSASGQPPMAPPPLPRMRGAKAARSTPNRRFRGVYERQPGRWAADFRSHRLNVRRWLGTFPSEEEAKAAYDAFEAQFSLGASVQAATAKRSIVLDESDQSETGLNHQVDVLSTVSSSPSPSPPRIFSSPAPVAAITSNKPLPYADEPQMEVPLLAEVLAHDELADLPLPSLDDELDFSSSDWSLLNIDVPVLRKKD